MQVQYIKTMFSYYIHITGLTCGQTVTLSCQHIGLPHYAGAKLPVIEGEQKWYNEGRQNVKCQGGTVIVFDWAIQSGSLCEVASIN